MVRGAAPGRRRTRRPVVITTTIADSARLFCAPLISALVAQGDSVVVVTSDRGGAPAGLQLHGAPLHSIRMHRRPAPLQDAGSLVRWIIFLGRVRPRGIIAMTPKASLLGLFAASLTGVPVRAYLLVGLRLEGVRGLSALVLGLAERLTSACATTVIANSPSLAAAYLERKLCPRDKLTCTDPGSDHGVDTHYFDVARAPETVAQLRAGDEDRVVVGFVGRVTEDKGVDTLAQALRDPRLRDRVTLLVVGSGEDPVSLEAITVLAEDVPVHLEGEVRDVRPWYALMHVLVLPTRREGFPNVVLEAAAMSIPSVTTTATGAVDSVVHGRTGLLVPVDAPGPLADALVSLVSDPALRERMGRAARSRAERCFAPEAVATSVLSMAGLKDA